MKIMDVNPNKNLLDASSLPTTGSVDELMKSAFSSLMINSYEDKIDVLQKINQPANSTDPEKLFEYQKRVQEYNINISMVSTLTRKAVNTVDTLLRS